MKKPPKDVVWCDMGWQPVYYGFCPNKKAWNRQMKRWGVKDPYPETPGRATTYHHPDGKVAVLVTLMDGCEKAVTLTQIVGIIAHEATHVWQVVRKEMGEKKPSSEFEAYSIQAITQELFHAADATRGPLGASEGK